MERILPNSLVDYAQKDGQSCDYGHYTAAELRQDRADQHVHERHLLHIRGKSLVVISSAATSASSIRCGRRRRFRRSEGARHRRRLSSRAGAGGLSQAGGRRDKSSNRTFSSMHYSGLNFLLEARAQMPGSVINTDRQPAHFQRIAGRRTAGMAATRRVIALALLGILGAAGQPLQKSVVRPPS
jgi:7,8-dihydropterin-6-yl-methyl-4-(beta-D-ribofuranosyl)aminobenzene 5'-phosphate synthase